jgi:4'-phosphopantetheinyl transferase
MLSEPPRPADAEDPEVRVACAPTSVLSDPAVMAAAVAWLDGVERERHARFHHDDDRRMFLLGRIMARVQVGRAMGVAPRAWTWRDGPRGRPEIADARTGVRFNLAHSAGLVVCAVASGRDVGVDVEHLARRPVDPAVVTRYCSPQEIADINLPDPGWHDRFLTHWTLKEAYLKARGLGIAVTLADLAFSITDTGARISFAGSLAGADDRWVFHLARPVATHVIAVAASTLDAVRPRFLVAPFADAVLDALAST